MSEALLQQNTKDLQGQRCGAWTVIDRAANNRFKKVQWNCVCDCGTIRVVAAASLIRGMSISCGCVKLSRSTKHGHCKNGIKTPGMTCWGNMIQRCTNPKAKHFNRYGGRGISVCHEWIGAEGFVRFIYDMGPKPTPSHTIERVNNELGYSKENCIWATRPVQYRNRRNNRLFTFNGETLCLVDWAKKIGISVPALCSRIYYRKWSIEKALSTPKNLHVRNQHSALSTMNPRTVSTTATHFPDPIAPK